MLYTNNYKHFFFRAESLAEVNAMLREQLAAANEGNEKMTEDMKKITDDLQKCQQDFEDVQEKLKTTEQQWKEEQEVSVLYSVE